MRVTTTSLFVAAALALCALPDEASASPRLRGQVHYQGGHPITAAADDGFCYIEVPHVHVYAPPKKAQPLYRVHDDRYVFVADPAPFEYDGPTHAYYGHHPIAVDVVVGVEPAYVEGQPLEYCYLEGPHYHGYEPPPGLTFEVEADAHWYIGDFGPRYKRDRRRYARINAYYEPIVYTRPVVVVDHPPAGYIGPFVDVHVVAPAAVVETPVVHGRAGLDVDVHIPTPSFSVEVGLPGVIIEDGHHHHRRHRKHKKFKKHKKWRGRGHWKH